MVREKLQKAQEAARIRIRDRREYDKAYAIKNREKKKAEAKAAYDRKRMAAKSAREGRRVERMKAQARAIAFILSSARYYMDAEGWQGRPEAEYTRRVLYPRLTLNLSKLAPFAYIHHSTKV